MVKQTKTFKKGNVTKKALSAILAASMVMTSSSFVMAAPVEVEDVAVEAAAVDEVAVGAEENVGVTADVTVNVAEATYNGDQLKPTVTVVDKTNGTLVEKKDYNLVWGENINAGENAGSVTVNFIGAYQDSKSVTQYFTIKPYVLHASDIGVSYDFNGAVYDGTEKKPTINTLTPYGTVPSVLTKNDFEVVALDATYDLKSVGSQKVKLNSKNNNFTTADDCGVFEFSIAQNEFSSSKISVVPTPSNYTGSPVEARVELKNTATNEVVDSSEYTIKYFDAEGKAANGPQTNCGTYNIQIISNGKGNYAAGVISSTYTIRKATLQQAAADAVIAGTKKVSEYNYSITYDGQSHMVYASDISIPGLTQDVDYKVTAISQTPIKDVDSSGNTKITVTLEGMNSYSGSQELSIRVAPKLITKDGYSITAKCSKGSTNPFVVIKDGDTKLKATDFNFTSDTTNKTVTITGEGNYTTNDGKGDRPITVPYTIASKIQMDDPNVVASLANASYTWTGRQITPSVASVTYNTSTPLTAGTDYTVSYGANVNAGEDAGTVILTGKGDYEGTKEIKFDITGIQMLGNFVIKPLNDISVTSAQAGNGKQTPVVTYPNGGTAPSDLTYTVKYYKDGKEVTNDASAFTTKGTITVKVTGTGKYMGEIIGTYNIVAGDALSDNAKVTPIADQQYTGKAIEPTVVVTDSATNVALTLGKDYTVSYENNVEVGTAYAVVTGIGKYTGNIVVSFNIVGEMDQNIEVLAVQERDLGNGSRTLNSKPTKIKYATAPKTSVTFKSSDENVVTVDAEGNIKYTGIGEATITIEAKAENGYKAAKKEVKVVVTLAKPSFTPFSKNNAFTLTSSTVKGAEKFEVEYATKKDFSNSKTKTFATTSAGKIRQVKVSAADKKTYYVRVRAISGTETSAWSATKTVATK